MSKVGEWEKNGITGKEGAARYTIDQYLLLGKHTKTAKNAIPISLQVNTQFGGREASSSQSREQRTTRLRTEHQLREREKLVVLSLYPFFLLLLRPDWPCVKVHRVVDAVNDMPAGLQCRRVQKFNPPTTTREMDERQHSMTSRSRFDAFRRNVCAVTANPGSLQRDWMVPIID